MYKDNKNWYYLVNFMFLKWQMLQYLHVFVLKKIEMMYNTELILEPGWLT